MNISTNQLDDVILGGLAIRLRLGFEISEEETDYYCALCNKDPRDLAEDLVDFYNKKCFENGELREAVRLNIYKEKLSNEVKLTENEKLDFAKLYHQQIEKETQALFKTLRKSGENNLKKIFLEHIDEIKKLTIECINFPTGTLMMGRKTIHWNTERMLHIFSKHVKGTFIKYNNKSSQRPKTLFLSRPQDVHNMLNNILEKLKDEINGHFTERPGSGYLNSNISYRGEIYSLRIDNTGLVMMFHKKEK